MCRGLGTTHLHGRSLAHSWVRDDCDRGSQKEYAIARSKSRQALNRTQLKRLPTWDGKIFGNGYRTTGMQMLKAKLPGLRTEDPSLVS